jgi:uncharacterized membrane protein
VRAWFLRLADRLGSSYWFVPSVMAVLAIVLATGMIRLDVAHGSKWIDSVPWLYAARANGARQMLSSIGGSMITVAGTVFSVTIAAVVYASGQYGPRLLTNFMRDRGNQVTLGTFIATFIYCLLVLRTVRSADESGGYSFVPDLSLLVAVGLALCSIAVLIFFIHHVPSKIHINSVIEEIGDGLLGAIEERFPRFIGDPRPDDDRAERAIVPRTFRKDASADDAEHRRLVRAKRTGYVMMIDEDALLSVARDHDLVLRLQYQSGDFAHAGRALAEAHPVDRCDEEACARIRDAFSLSSRRSTLQDLRFLVDELVEIAARALSPGVNDPFTALTCMDWLSAGLSNLASRDIPSHLRVDKDGALRVIAHPVSFEAMIDRSFGALAQYCAADMVAALRFVRALGEVALDCDHPDRRDIISSYANRFDKLAEEALTGFNRTRVRDRVGELQRALAEPDYKRHLRDSTAWLGGTA